MRRRRTVRWAARVAAAALFVIVGIGPAGVVAGAVWNAMDSDPGTSFQGPQTDGAIWN